MSLGWDSMLERCGLRVRQNCLSKASMNRTCFPTAGKSSQQVYGHLQRNIESWAIPVKKYKTLVRWAFSGSLNGCGRTGSPATLPVPALRRTPIPCLQQHSKLVWIWGNEPLPSSPCNTIPVNFHLVLWTYKRSSKCSGGIGLRAGKTQ